MVQAAIDVNGISPSQKIRLTDEIFAQHPQTLTARERFNEGLPKDLADQMVQQFCDEHRQRYLLAFVYGYLGDNELMQARTDAEKYLMLAVLNLVECLAEVGTTTVGLRQPSKLIASGKNLYQSDQL